MTEGTADTARRRKIRQSVARMGAFCVYIVECSDHTYYTGYTNDLERRLKEHNEGIRGAKYTKGRRPVKLVYTREFMRDKKVNNSPHIPAFSCESKSRDKRGGDTHDQVWRKT